jgi:hypothetical protein
MRNVRMDIYRSCRECNGERCIECNFSGVEVHKDIPIEAEQPISRDIDECPYERWDMK